MTSENQPWFWLFKWKHEGSTVSEVWQPELSFHMCPTAATEWNSPVAAHYLRDTIQDPHYSFRSLQELATAMSPTTEPTTLASLILLPPLWLLGCSLNRPSSHLPHGLCTYCFLCLKVSALIVLGSLSLIISLLKWSLSLTCFIFFFFRVLILPICYISLFICLLSVSPH